MNDLKQPCLRRFAVIAACALLVPSVFATDGYFIQGFGAVNSSLGGAAAAGNDQDLIGSIYKNPATALLFADRTASIVFGDIMPDAQVDSSVSALGLSGSSQSTSKNVPYLSLMASWKPNGGNLAWFAGAVSEAGLSFHAATSSSNPVFFPQSGAANNPFGGQFGGFGDVRSSLYVVRLPLGLAVASDTQWSWGFALAPSIGRNLFTPAAFAAPGIGANHAPVYAAVQQQDIQLGLGAQGGLRYQADADLSFGLSMSTPTWFNSYSWTVDDPSGASRTVTFRMDRPLTAQLGMNYALLESTHLIADVGYIAYGSTPGFENSGFRADGSMAGLGWKDSETVEIGVQQALGKAGYLRLGYNFCSNPIPASATFYNVGSPLHLEQHLSVGASFILGPGSTLDLSYTHGFSHTQSGPWDNLAGAVPGTDITSTISGDEFCVGTTFRF